MLSITKSRFGFFFVALFTLLFYLFFYPLSIGKALLPIDDAYMYMRYADHLLEGSGMAWNSGGELTYGLTSILNGLYVTFLKWLCMVGGFCPSMDFLLLFSSWLMGLLVLVSLPLLCYLNVSSPYLKNYWVLAALIWPALVFFPFSARNFLNGLETMLAVETNILLIGFTLCFLQQPSIWKGFLVGFFAYLTFSARPDNGIYAAFFPTLAILLLLPQHKLRFFFLFSAVFGFFLLVDAWVKFSLFGDIVPLSFFVKKANFYGVYLGEFRWNPVENLLVFLGLSALFSGFILLFYRRETVRFTLTFLLPVLGIIFYYFSVNQITGSSARFYYPSIPFLIVCGVVLLDHFLDDSSKLEKVQPTLWRFTLFVLIVFFILFNAERLEDKYAKYFFNKKHQEILNALEEKRKDFASMTYTEANLRMGELVKKFPSDVVLAATEVGYIGALLPHNKLIDIAGLQERHIAHHGFSMEFLLVQAPDFIWMPHMDYLDLVNQIANNPKFLEEYEYYPEVFNYGVALRKKGKHYSLLKDLLEQSIDKEYQKATLEGIPRKLSK